MKRARWVLAALACLLCLVAAFPAGSTQPEQVHLSYLGNATMTVTWVTQAQVQKPVFMYGLSGPAQNVTVLASWKLFSDFGQDRSFYVYSATTAQLPPSVRFYYKVGDMTGAGWSNLYSFVSVPSLGSPVRYAVYADFGYNNSQSLGNLLNETGEGHFDAVLHVGDIAYDMDSFNSSTGDLFMNAIEPMTASVPYQVSPGNHEADEHLIDASFYNFQNRFVMPGNASNMYYSYDIGFAHIVSMSTEHYFWFPWYLDIAKQYAWLEADLAAANARRSITPWIILVGHRPMYCSDDSVVLPEDLVNSRLGHLLGGRRRGAKQDGQEPAATVPPPSNYSDCTVGAAVLRDGPYGIEALLWKYGVDLYICGHEHSYERSWPVYQSVVHNSTSGNPYVDPTAPIHILTGAAGNQEDLDGFGPPGPWTAFRSATYGYGHMNIVNATHLEFQQVLDSSGSFIDQVWIVQNNHGPFGA